MRHFLAVAGFLAASFSTQAAVELGASTGFTALPTETYGRLSFAADLGVTLSNTWTWTVGAGSALPYQTVGYQQYVVFGGTEFIYRITKSSWSFDFGTGLGVYADVVSREGETVQGVIPSVILSHSIRWGGKNIGVFFTPEVYIGVYDARHPIFLTVWPLCNLLLGFYIGL